MKALIIVDVQNDFMPWGSLPVAHADSILPAIVSETQKNYTIVIASQDWHPASHNSFASNHSGKKAFDKITLNGIEQTLWPNHCVRHTYGAMLHPQLKRAKIHYILKKGTDKNTDSYSVFTNNMGVIKQSLICVLNQNDIDEITFCGLAGDFCVAHSVNDAFKLGYKVRILTTGIKAISPSTYSTYLEQWKKQGAILID